MTDEELFEGAQRLSESQQRDYFENHAGDELQIERVKSLLRADQEKDSLLDLASTAESPAADSQSVDQIIGNYKLLQKIGEGGMGTVYMAEQLRPVKRVVAFKVIKAGMGSKQVVARFEAERQSLALMDHPNIAKVLDAGWTGDTSTNQSISGKDPLKSSDDPSATSGLPYFVMELVKGVPISKYCNDNRLSTEQRVRLMMDVCNAIQHAHQKGIIHRDLKPSNILVAQYDDRPVPKVIDFGVAKATHQKLTEKTLYTQLGQIVGTLEYMSPEQAVLNQLDVDTRTDVYSLGVILYELLVGETPINGKELRSQGLEQILRIIREQEPPRPSLRLSSQGEAATQTAAYQMTDQGSLSRTLRGDLDWIVMKALEKDRSRRYDSASRLSEDLNNYLQGDSVEARPPTIGYRVAKIWKRNRTALSTILVIVACLTGALSFATIQWQRTQTVVDRLQNVLVDSAITDAMSGNFARAERTIKQASDANVSDSLLVALRCLSSYFSGKPVEAAAELRQATEEHPDSIEVWSVYFLASHSAGDYGAMGECRRRVQGLSPSSDAQRLFKAMTNVYADSEESLEQLRPLLKLNPRSPILQAIQAVASRDIAQRTRSMKEFELIVDTFSEASDSAPNNFFIETEYLLALVDAFKLAESLGQADLAQTYTNKAASLARTLELNDPRLLYSRMARSTYYAAVGNSEMTKRIEELKPTSVTRKRHVLDSELFAQRKYEDAIGFDSLAARTDTILGAFRAIESAPTDESRKRVAHEAFNFCRSNRPDYATGSDVIALEAFILAGDLESLKIEAAKLPAVEEVYEWHLYPRMVKLYEDPSDVAMDNLLAFVRPFPEETCYAEYCVGLLRLSQGRRTEAIVHFQNCRQQGKYDWWSHVWAGVFLERLKSNHKWPHWIASSSSRDATL